MEGRHVVIVTGGSGCLGQHIIKLLQTRADHVDEIRVLDVVPFEKKLDYKERVPVTSLCTDISDLTDTTAFQGVKTVFHLASVISVTNFPNIPAMERVNVKGTYRVLEACVKENVDRLVYCSTVDVVCGYNNIIDGTEDNTIPPDNLLYQGYAGTKLQAEKAVIDYNGNDLPSGGTFQTVSLRPTVFFGELDSYYIPIVLQKARSNGGVFIQLGDGSALYQHSYVGNIAWAFLCAERSLLAVSSGSSGQPQTTSNAAVNDQTKDSDMPCDAADGQSGIKQDSSDGQTNIKQDLPVSGEVFFITDDCEPQGMSRQIQPFLEAAGCRVSSYKLPFYPVYGLVQMTQGLLWLLSPMVKIDLGFSAMSLRYINTSYTYNTTKARRMLGYTPIFTPEESIQQANSYYVGST